MINSTSENVRLTLEQMHQLEVVQTRLSGLQMEEKNARRALSAVANDCSRITKEKEYQEELLAKVTEQVNESQSRVTSLDEHHLAATESLGAIVAEISSKSSLMSEKEKSLKDREDAASAREQEIFDRNEALVQRELAHEEHRERMAKKVAMIGEAIAQF